MGKQIDGQADDEEAYKVKLEYGVSGAVIFIGVFFIAQALTIETSREAIGPRTMPMILAVLLLLSGLWLGLRAYMGRSGVLKEGYGFLESDVKRIFMVIGSGALFVVLFWGLGYFTALIFTFIAMLYTFGVRHWLRMALGGVVLAFAFQALFMGVMLLNDPKGAVVDLRPYTNWIAGVK